VDLCGCFIMRIMLLSLGLFFMACLFVNAGRSSLFFQLTFRDKFFSIEKNNVLLCVRYKKHDIKNNRRVVRGTPCKNVRAMAFARCEACAVGFSFSFHLKKKFIVLDVSFLTAPEGFLIYRFCSVLYCLHICVRPCIVLVLCCAVCTSLRSHLPVFVLGLLFWD
jgi:hypothetical protein